ncbi:MAG TPA: N-acetylglutamate synthase, partial [Fibrobacteres bacterium]|nr:N-acetylglutamate synthase [Fibrobacterota bacterium]
MPVAAEVPLPGGIVIRPARTTDVRGIRALVDEYAADRVLLSKA